VFDTAWQHSPNCGLVTITAVQIGKQAHEVLFGLLASDTNVTVSLDGGALLFGADFNKHLF